MLSVVVITLNEAHNLGRCLDSVSSLATEIIVVDSGSVDGTAEVAASFGAKVLIRPFTTYADQKNWAARQVSQSYVLSLDADESLSPELQEEMAAWKLRVMRADAEHPVAWSMPRLTNYLGNWVRHGGWYPDVKVRLWKAGAGEWQTGAEGKVLHEFWAPHQDHPQAVGHLHSDLWHHSFHTVADHQRQVAKFSALGARDALALGRHVGWGGMWFRPVFQWVKQYFVQGGFRDGKTGWQIAYWSAVASHWKWRQVKHGSQLPSTVGVVRTDALGDNVLTLPMAGALKVLLPDVKVVWIVRAYAQTLVKTSDHVDEVRVWDPEGENPSVLQGLDAVVFAFPEPKLMREAARLGVPVRVGTARRWGSLPWLNRRVWVSRKRSDRHESLQGLRLLHALHIPAMHRFPTVEECSQLTGLNPQGTKTELAALLGVSEDILTRVVVVHPGNHGSAQGWSLDRFRQLILMLIQDNIPVVVTGSSQESRILDPWMDSWISTTDGPVFSAIGRLPFMPFMALLREAKVVVASSTGPLHMAAAMGTPVVGLYRSEAPFWPQRWGPLGQNHQILATEKMGAEGGLDVAPDEVFKAVLQAGPCLAL
ncbi:MAG: glycosyltransferase [Bacteroidetes bacterium]|nr:glycosyltransferase [Bacteroidota bacterium]MDA0903558.1 glycosyltransferase [Bacteroidota bacterium]MDA1242135.1 glycosyltransferase [Bacteroidota bacterium]